MTSDGIYNLVRALARPYPGAHVEYKGNIIKVWKVRKTMCDYVNKVCNCLAHGEEVILHDRELAYAREFGD